MLIFNISLAENTHSTSGNVYSEHFFFYTNLKPPNEKTFKQDITRFEYLIENCMSL